MRTCAYTECGRSFEARAHNQKYCSDDCCRRSTNARLMEQYYERKERRQGLIRVCTTPGCETRLSRYNEGKICQKCEAATVRAARDNLLEMMR